MVKFFYSRAEHSSEQQLHDDFGEFPPDPLQCKAPEFKFVVVRTRGPGAWLNYWTRSAEVLKILQSKPESISPPFREALDTLIAINTAYDPDSGTSKTTCTFLAPHSLMRLLIARSLWKFEASHKSGLAYVLPISSCDNQITLLGKIHRKPERIAAVLSHEHLHLLQNARGVSHIKEVFNPHQVLNSECVHERTMLYLLERREVEARLHELVLSHYRSCRSLPQSLDTFLTMLADWADVGELLAHYAEIDGTAMNSSGTSFHPRSTEFSEELANMLELLKDQNATKRFVCEVLPIMYANLLRYYGDAPASQRFLSGIPRPNLYDELYN